MASERVPEFYESMSRVLFRVWTFDAVMQVNLHLAPSIMAMLGQTLYERLREKARVRA